MSVRLPRGRAETHAMEQIQIHERLIQRRSGFAILKPPGPAPKRGWPAVLALHGYGDNGRTFCERLAALSGEGFALVAPDGPFPVAVDRNNVRRIGRSWYAYSGAQEEFLKSLQEAESDLGSWVQECWAQHGLDLQRTALIGYSMGGYLGAFLALRRSDVFRALVVVSCRVKVEFLGSEMAKLRGYPVLGIHGARDESTAVEPQSRAFEALVAAGLDARLVVHSGGHGFRRAQLPEIACFLERSLRVS